MRGSRYLLLFVVFLGLGLLAACGEDDSGGGARTPVTRKGGKTPTEKAPLPEHRLEMEWWRRKVPISLFLTGGEMGMLRPCGCDTPPMGGLERAAIVLDMLQERQRKADGVVAAMSLGSSAKATGEEQEEAKAAYLRAAQDAMGYAAVLLGSTDVRVNAMTQPQGDTGAAVPHPPINVRLAPVNPAVDSLPLVDLNLRTLKVRALSVVEPDEADALQSGFFADAAMSISRALEGLQPRPDTLWVIAIRLQYASTLQTLKGSLKRLGGGIIIDVSGKSGLGEIKVDDRRVAADTEPLVVRLDRFGKAVGVLDVTPAEDGASWSVNYRRIALVPQWEKYDRKLARDVRALEALYRTSVRQRGYLKRLIHHADDGASYVGSSKCAECHGAIYRDWRKSVHAGALDTLEKIDYHWDPECVRCHTDGWERGQGTDWIVTETGFRDPDTTPYLGGVGCEGCHGPGSTHVADPYNKSLFDKGGPNVTKPGLDVCMRCHDEENSHRFQARYKDVLPLVNHEGVPLDRRTVVPPEKRQGK